MSRVSGIFSHIAHARTLDRLHGRVHPPPKVDEMRVGLNGRVGLFVTTIVGTMWAAYLFTLLALVSFPTAIRSGSSLVIVAWTAQTFLQLVLLPIIIVGQNIQARASDKRAEETYRDTEALLHEIVQVQEHLAAQDSVQEARFVEIKEFITGMNGPQSP